jgi:hypothetical protein
MLRRPRSADHPLGRLYRVRHDPTLRPAGRFDLAWESHGQLVQRLHSPNQYFRETAQRLLAERNSASSRGLLRQLVCDGAAPRKARLAALWALIGGGSLEPDFHLALLHHSDPAFRAWGARAAGEFRRVAPAVRDRIVALAQDPAPDVRLQVAIAAGKIEGLDPLPVLIEVASHSSEDPLIPAIVWQNLLPLLDRRGGEFRARVGQLEPRVRAELNPIRVRAIAYQLGRPGADPAFMVALFEALTAQGEVDADVTRQVLGSLAEKFQTGELAGAPQASIRGALAFAQ